MSSDAPPIEAVAAIAQRLAVLLAAGVPPNAAWRYLEEAATDAASVPHRQGDGVQRGGAVSGAFKGGRAVGRRARADAARASALTAGVLRAASRAGLRGENIAEAIRLAAQPHSTDRPTATAASRVSVGAGAGAGAGASAPVAAKARAAPVAKGTGTVTDPPDITTVARAPALGATTRGPTEQRSARAWLALAAAWAVAQESGAPLASTLRELAVAFRDQAQLERDLAVALSGPRATARMVGAMPAIGVLFGALMGFDTVHTLLFTAPGLICLVVGGALMIAGSRWSDALVRRAAGGLDNAGLLVQLTAIAMSGGTSSERARALAEQALERYAASGVGRQGDERHADGIPGRPSRARPRGAGESASPDAAGVAAIDGVLALSRRAGVPAAELLRSEAEQARLEARSAGQQRAAKLGVTLMIPLGLCVLPAFMLLGVVPLLISVLASTLSVL